MTSEAHREQIRRLVQQPIAMRFGIPPETVEISDELAAYLFAADLMRGDPGTLKAGYTAPSAWLAALDVFPDVDVDELATKLGVPVADVGLRLIAHEGADGYWSPQGELLCGDCAQLTAKAGKRITVATRAEIQDVAAEWHANVHGRVECAGGCGENLNE